MITRGASDGAAGSTDPAPKILVIEDDADCREAICQMLADEGFESLSAENGRDGLARAIEAHPALILCDVRMPLMDGYDTLARLRGTSSTADVPFVFLSANVDLKDVRRGMNLGADDYLVKPFSVDELLGAVRARLRRSVIESPTTRSNASTLPEPIAASRSGRAPPSLIADRYRVIRRVGGGAMSSVYAAHDIVRDRQVAVKFIPEDSAWSLRFERECAILASLRHPRVVGYQDHGVTADGGRFLTMDWLFGQDLSARLDRGLLDVRDTMRVLRNAAEALAVIHSAGIIHRDIKPSNLFLVDGDIEKLALIDFGIAHPPGVAHFTATGELLGTPGYLAPEQIEHACDADPRSDVFGLACTVYACLTGASPFHGATVMASLALLLVDDAPPPLRASAPEVSDGINDLVAAMLERDRSRRPADGRAILDALDALGAHG